MASVQSSEVVNAARPVTRSALAGDRTAPTTASVSEKDRQLAVVASLAALGSKAASLLPQEINGALDSGATRQELVEGLATISQAVGTPSAVNAIYIATKTFKMRDEQRHATEGERVWDAKDSPGGTVQERWERAVKTIERVYPDGPHDDVYTAVQHVAPHFWRDVATVFYDDIFNHPGIEIKYRELFVLSTYVALNTTSLQLKWHANGALNNGWTRRQLLEIVAHLADDVGIPKALAATALLKEVFDERDAREAFDVEVTTQSSSDDTAADLHFTRGMQNLSWLNPNGVELGRGWEAAESLSPTLHRAAVRQIFGDLLEVSHLDVQGKHLAVVSSLVAIGGVPDQLAFHIEAALNWGITRQEIDETIRIASAIGGSANGSNANAVASDVYRRRQRHSQHS